MFGAIAKIILGRKSADLTVERRFPDPYKPGSNITGSYLVNLIVREAKIKDACVVDAHIFHHKDRVYYSKDEPCLGIFPKEIRESLTSIRNDQPIPINKEGLLAFIAKETGLLPIMPPETQPKRSLAAKLNQQAIGYLEDYIAQFHSSKRSRITSENVGKEADTLDLL